MYVLLALLAIAILIALGVSVVGLAAVLLWYALVGLVIGALARLLVPGSGGYGLLATILAGIGGALLGGVLAAWLDAGGVLELVFTILSAGIIVAATTGGMRTGQRSAGD